MYQGNLIEEGDVEDIFYSPKENYTKALLAAVPQLGEMAGTSEPRPMNIPGHQPVKAPSSNRPSSFCCRPARVAERSRGSVAPQSQPLQSVHSVKTDPQPPVSDVDSVEDMRSRKKFTTESKMPKL